MGMFVCPVDAARMRSDAEYQFSQAAEERSKLEEKVAQVERKAFLTLNNKEQIHRDQLEAERRKKVHYKLRGCGYVNFDCIKYNAVACF